MMDDIICMTTNLNIPVVSSWEAVAVTENQNWPADAVVFGTHMSIDFEIDKKSQHGICLAIGQTDISNANLEFCLTIVGLPVIMI